MKNEGREGRNLLMGILEIKLMRVLKKPHDFLKIQSNGRKSVRYGVHHYDPVRIRCVCCSKYLVCAKRIKVQKLNSNNTAQNGSIFCRRLLAQTLRVVRMISRCLLTFRHRASSIQDRFFATLQRTLFIYLIKKYISLSDICLTVHH